VCLPIIASLAPAVGPTPLDVTTPSPLATQAPQGGSPPEREGGSNPPGPAASLSLLAETTDGLLKIQIRRIEASPARARCSIHKSIPRLTAGSIPAALEERHADLVAIHPGELAMPVGKAGESSTRKNSVN